MTTYRINWDALAARIVYRWRWRSALGALLLCASAALTAGLVPPVWRGAAALVLEAPPGAAVEVDGHPWPHPLYAGRHTVRATLPDGRSSWANVTLRPEEPLALTLPPGLPAPLVRPLPPAAPGARIAKVEWTNGAWRATSLATPAVDSASTDTSATPTPDPGRTVAFGAQGTERLSTIDAYAGLADQLRLGERRVEAVYRPAERSFADEPGVVEVRGWGAALATVPLSAELTLVRLAPDGASLLLAERAPGGEQVSVAGPHMARIPVVAVPGRLVRISWRDDGGAAVLHSESGERLALTLVRLRPSIAAATVAERDSVYAGGLMPLTWSADGLLWLAPDPDGAMTLWEAPVATLIPQRHGPLDARALDALDGGGLRVLALVGDQLLVGLYRDGALAWQASVPHVPPSDSLAGIWHDDELLLHSGDGAWLATFR